MDEFCGSDFWDSKTAWDTDDPDFTLCFEKTVLVWIPCAFLWVLVPVEIYYLRHSKTFDIPLNLYNVTKLVAIFILATISLTDIIHNVIFHDDYYPVDFYSPLVKFFIFVIFFGLTYANVKFGRRSSAVLFLFSLILVISGAPQFRTEFRLRWSTYEKPQTMEFISYVIYYIIVVVVFLMNCFADSRPRIAPHPFDKNECPKNQFSFLFRVLFTWFEPMVWKGYRKSLENGDLWNLDHSISSTCIVPKFEKHWKKLLEEIKNRDQLEIKMMQERGRDSIGGIRYKCDEKKKGNASIVPILFRTFGSTFMKGTLLKIFLDVFVFVNPLILSLLIDFIGSDEPMWRGYTYAILLFLAAVIQTLMSSQYQHIMYTIGLKMRTCLISIIYKKSLRTSNSARRDFTVGEIVNLMSVDASRFVDLLSFSYLLISTPLQIALTIFFLWKILGPSVLGGFVIMIISILINIYIGSAIKSCQVKQMKEKDSRIKLMNQILSGIKVLKLYSWEPSFEKQVLSVRNKEMKVLRKQAYLTGIATFTWSSTSFLVCVIIFAVYVLSSDKNILDAKIVFVSLSLFNILKIPLFLLPQMISNLVQASVSVKRINKFLNSQDLNSDEVTHEKIPEALLIENASFSWEEFNGSPTLRDINVKINPGALVAVVGPVGSGKSSLISAFLGEMYKLSGVVNTKGTIAYVPQQAWIQNTTVKDNITFGEPVRAFYYDQVLEACALKPDLKIFPGGDLTEIGEKGINLSGGQKQRLSLARAVYNGADIYLLDDPLSSVDSHVGKHIFEKVIGPNGLLKEQTRVLVTHSVTYLSQVDLIIIMKNGSISQSGSFQDLLDNEGDFADVLATYLEEDTECNEEDLDILEEVLAKKRVSIVAPRHKSFDNPMDLSALCRKRRSVISITGGFAKNRESKASVNNIIIGQRLTEIEYAGKQNLSSDVYKYYIKSAGFFVVAGTFFANFFLQVLSFVSNVWLTKWTDDSNATTPKGTQNINIRDFYLSIYILLGLSKCVVEFISDIFIRVGGCMSAKVLHNSLLSNIFRLPLSFMDVTPGGRILSRFSSDVDVVDNCIPHLVAAVIFCIGDVICNLFIISCSTPIFITVILPIIILYYLVQRFYVATSKQLKRLESVSRSPMYSHFVETVVGAQSIRAYGLSEKFIKQAEEKVDNNHKSYYLNIVSSRWLAVRAEMISNMIIFFAALFAVLDRDTISPGVAGLSIGYTLQITLTLSWSIYKASEMQTNMVSVERIKEYTEKPQEAAWKLPNEQIPENWPSKGDIDFQDFKVRYREGLEMVLKGITFFVSDGQKVGIVGRTGAGKSSLTLSLFRILESAGGKILIDGIDIATLGLHTLRSKLTIIPQDPILFSGSLRMNLDPFDEYSDENLWRALELAHLKWYISTLDDGLRCEVIEGGENFSVGQRQLICLARALLRKTKILIMDEATAAVDLETDDLIQNTIRKEFRDCTVLTIAHRLNTVMDYDKILVIDEGYVAEYDSPYALLKSKRTLFYRMAADAGLV